MNKENATTTPTTAIVAILIIAILVVGATFAATTTVMQSAFAVGKKGGGQQENSKNGNTVTIQKCKQAATQSGFDNKQQQECANLICTHPGNNTTCVSEGQAVPGAGAQTPVNKNTCEQCFTSFLNAEQIANVTGDFGVNNLEQLCALIPEFPENVLRFAIAGSPGGSLSLADQIIQCLKDVGIVFAPPPPP